MLFLVVLLCTSDDRASISVVNSRLCKRGSESAAAATDYKRCNNETLGTDANSDQSRKKTRYRYVNLTPVANNWDEN